MDNKFYNELSKFKKAENTKSVELEKVELATVKDLIEQGKNAKKLIAKAEKELNALKTQAKITADAIDNFINEPYFQITQNIRKVRQQAKELGVDLPNELEDAYKIVDKARGELGNGRASNWFKEINKL
jgi:hypothetical protein